MSESIMKDIENIIRTHDTCVLATTGDEGPHASLMTYGATPDCRTLYLVTPKQTLKYKNLTRNASVSILIDTRCEETIQNVRALTISGTAGDISDAALRRAVRRQFIEKHPDMKEFVDSKDSAFISVSIHSLQFLSGLQESRFIRLD